MAEITGKTKAIIETTLGFCARNYIPAEVVFSHGSGVWLTDVDGNRYLDMLAAYSAINFGHCNPRIETAAIAQLRRLTLTSRAFHNDQLGPFARELAELCGMECILPMNSGAEAVESAIKLARKWGYEKKGIPDGQAEIIVFGGNFHGRTTTIVSFSDSPASYTHFGPLTPGFVQVPYGDIAALEQAITSRTAAVLIEPIQGEGGVIIPPDGYLSQVRTLCDQQNVLFLADEIQTGLCRTGKVFACEHEGVKPDLYILGKSLGGGIVPLSAIVGSQELIATLSAGTHGSTFGGNPFACGIAREVLALIREEKPHDMAHSTGAYMAGQFSAMKLKKVKSFRIRGLMCGVDIYPEFGKAKDLCKQLLKEGVVTYHTREQTVRIAPPLMISQADLDWGLERVARVLG